MDESLPSMDESLSSMVENFSTNWDLICSIFPSKTSTFFVVIGSELLFRNGILTESCKRLPGMASEILKLKESISAGNAISSASDTSRELDGGSGIFVSKEVKLTDGILTQEGVSISQLEPKHAKDGVAADQHHINAEDQTVLDLHYFEVVRKAIAVVVKSVFSKEALDLVERRLDRCMQETENTLPNATPPDKQLEDVIIVHNLQQSNAVEANNLLF
ncbi:hypothetical protein M5K25_014542 [Dendrobium thyrsiflorum]|uniref:Uncharacterized protein n=1 Tax=Dendrobium thyrsiflorum TaxID=117978 RepID=A0ABD0V2W5_DENTH